MSGWITLAIVLGGFVFTYRRAYLALIVSDERNAKYMGRPVDNESKALTAAMSMLIALMWPVTLAGYFVWRVATPISPGQKMAELEAREREIERLERELGLPRSPRRQH